MTPTALHRLRPLALLLPAVLAACAAPQRPTSLAEMLPPQSATTATSPARAPGAAGAAEAADASDPAAAQNATARRQRVYLGNDRVVDLTAGRPAQPQGPTMTLNFEAAPLSDVVQSIVGDILRKPYSIAGELKGEVTLRTTSPVAVADVGAILEAVLAARGYGMVTDPQGTVHIGPNDALKAIPSSPAQTVGRTVSVVPLQHIGAREMADILKPLAPPDGIVRVDPLRNLLVLQGTQNQTRAWVDLVRTFDVDALAGMSVGVFALENADVRDVAKAIDLIAARGDGPVEGAMRVLPVERLNSLLVIAPRRQLLESVKEWIARLDQPVDDALQPKLHVYPVQHGNAAQLARVLNALYGGRGGGATPDAARGTLAPGLTAATAASPATTTARPTGAAASPTANLGAAQGATAGTTAGTAGAGAATAASRPTLGSATAAPAATGAGAAATAATPTTVDLDGDIRIVADDATNTLLIQASRRAYRRIEQALRQIDVAPAQVLIEATIVEVSLTDKLQYGLQWYFTNGLGGRLDGKTGVGSLVRGATSALAPVVPGFNYTITDGSGNIRAVLSALASETGLKVVSSPSLLALDNQPAEIRVGNQQPVRSATTTTSGGNVTESITYKDTGVLLRVVPRINAGGVVTLDIVQEVTDVGAIDSATGQRSFLQRSLQSRIAIPSGQTAVLGGLIKDNSSNSKSGLPLLSDIPGLGALFGATEKSVDRTELLVVLTPRVLENAQQLIDVSDEIRTRLTRGTPGAVAK